MKISTSIEKHGNSYGVHLSDDILKSMCLVDGDEIAISLPIKLPKGNKDITFWYGKAADGEIKNETVIYRTKLSIRGVRQFMIIPAAYRNMYAGKERVTLTLMPTAKPRLKIT